MDGVGVFPSLYFILGSDQPQRTELCVMTTGTFLRVLDKHSPIRVFDVPCPPRPRRPEGVGRTRRNPFWHPHRTSGTSGPCTFGYWRHRRTKMSMLGFESFGQSLTQGLGGGLSPAQIRRVLRRRHQVDSTPRNFDPHPKSLRPETHVGFETLVWRDVPERKFRFRTRVV